MVTIIISICLLITPFILAFCHSIIIYSQNHSRIYANYFIACNFSIITFINSYMCLLYGDSVSKFQGWIFTPAIFQIGIFQLSMCFFSIIAIIKKPPFKAACLVFFSIYSILSSFTLLTDDTYNEFIVALFTIDLITAMVAYILYALLDK
ncbi:hypothetical protein EDC55_10536 [Allofrancisella inopinata]|uniref:Uncharacterized protein n=1 Tax=Allofrancisella inopinata TaxID=1085647 RepID=A0AAE7CQH9_9GAMM|nr:hypothetical protein E4K63_02995 [Allofrancisella inopinata]TDT72891.1 hypothetical protein EDC55_10536 [Allofrancisella inopinata]